LHTAGSPATVITNGNAALSGTNYNKIEFPPYNAGATEYCVWLTATSGSATLGKVGCTSAISNPTVNVNLQDGMAFGSAYAANMDAGDVYYKILHTSNAAGDSSSLPAANTTGSITAAGGFVGNLTGNITGNVTGNLTGVVLPYVLYSVGGTALPTCNSGIQGEQAVVSDASSPTYMGTYTGSGSPPITMAVICSYNGTTYAWLTH
jgi:hypothetical protein